MQFLGVLASRSPGWTWLNKFLISPQGTIIFHHLTTQEDTTCAHVPAPTVGPTQCQPTKLALWISCCVYGLDFYSLIVLQICYVVKS